MSQQATLSLSTKDVIHIEGFQENASLFKNESTLRIRTILQQLQTACTESGMGLSEVNALMEQGIPCEVLQPGAADWQVGRIRLSLEFQLGTPIAATTTIAGTVALQPSTVAALPTVYDRPEVIAATAVVAPPIVPEVIEMSDVEDDFTDLDATSVDSSLNPGLDATNFGMADLDADLMDDFMESDLDDAFGESLDLGELGELDGLSEMMPDSSLEESVNTSLDLSDLSDMDGLGDGLTDDLSFDLDSQAVGSANLSSLDNPWDLNDDLDEMLLKNGAL